MRLRVSCSRIPLKSRPVPPAPANASDARGVGPRERSKEMLDSLFDWRGNHGKDLTLHPRWIPAAAGRQNLSLKRMVRIFSMVEL
jgi:hypothetical protein